MRRNFIIFGCIVFIVIILGILVFNRTIPLFPIQTSEVTPTPMPYVLPNNLPTPAVTSIPHNFASGCIPQGKINTAAVNLFWLESNSYDTSTGISSTKSYNRQYGKQENFSATGNILAVDVKLLSAFSGDGLLCLQGHVHWDGIPGNISTVAFVHNYADDTYQQGQLITNPNALPIVINLDKGLYVPNSGIKPTEIPYGKPITLSIHVSTVNGSLYDSATTGNTFTFTRTK